MRGRDMMQAALGGLTGLCIGMVISAVLACLVLFGLPVLGGVTQSH